VFFHRFCEEGEEVAKKFIRTALADTLNIGYENTNTTFNVRRAYGKNKFSS
jgi:hypothetical protein